MTPSTDSAASNDRIRELQRLTIHGLRIEDMAALCSSCQRCARPCAQRRIDRRHAQTLPGHGEGGAATARADIEHGLASGEAERGNRGVGELQRERLENRLIHADVIIPSLRLLVRLRGRR